MKRSTALVQLSRDHHQALFVAQRLRRDEEGSQAAALFEEFWNTRGRRHFQIEEEVLLPRWTAAREEPSEHIARIAFDHVRIRAAASRLDAGEPVSTLALGELLHDHVRFEERVVFPQIEEDLSADALDRLAAELASADA